MRKNNKNIAAATDATNKEPSHDIGPQSLSHRDQKTRPNILRRLNEARFFFGQYLKKKIPKPKMIVNYHNFTATNH